MPGFESSFHRESGPKFPEDAERYQELLDEAERLRRELGANLNLPPTPRFEPISEERLEEIEMRADFAMRDRVYVPTTQVTERLRQLPEDVEELIREIRRMRAGMINKEER